MLMRRVILVNGVVFYAEMIIQPNKSPSLVRVTATHAFANLVLDVTVLMYVSNVLQVNTVNTMVLMTIIV